MLWCQGILIGKLGGWDGLRGVALIEVLTRRDYLLQRGMTLLLLGNLFNHIILLLNPVCIRLVNKS